MRIALGADHAGVDLKNQIKASLEARGLECRDFGTATTDPVDYPDVAVPVARAVAQGDCQRGILVCGSGIGMAMAANKIAGIRAASVSDEASAALCRTHNDANVLTLGARLMTPELARRLVATFLDTSFAGGRHEARIAKLQELDQALR
jgi:ribose 5-phosphate isomerase B